MKRRHVMKLALAFTATCWAILLGTAVAADADLLSTIRNDDISSVRMWLTSGADPNARDDIGATALMHAAAFSSLDSLRALLDSGADVNASSPAGATALMWAVGDVAKVRLLLDRKADASASANARAELLRIVSAERPEARTMLASAGIEAKTLTTSGTPTLANYPVSATSAIRGLLDLGASPNPRGRFPLIALAAFGSRTDTARLLLDRGGRDQFIAASATAWAVIALAYAL